METTEQANAHLSKAGNTTKHMSSAQRTDELTDQILFWNEQRRQRMPAQLQRKREQMEAQARDLERELESALAKCRIERDSLPRYVEELRSLAKSLEGTARCADIPVNQIRDSIELLTASIHAKTRMIRRDADTAKARARLRRLRRGETKRLGQLLLRFEEMTGASISVADALSGGLPWAMLGEQGPDLASKRDVCDLHMKLARTREEIIILVEEQAKVETNRHAMKEYMSERVSCIDGLLAIPFSDRPKLGQQSTRYELVQPSDGVLAGLRAFFMESSKVI